MTLWGFERFINTNLPQKELEGPIKILNELLEAVDRDPKSCDVYDRVTKAMVDLASAFDSPDGEVAGTFFSLYLARRKIVVALHRGECDNFSKHVLGAID